MRTAFVVITFFFTSICLAQLGTPKVFPDNLLDSIFNERPEFFVLEWEQGTVLTNKETDIYIEVDSTGIQSVDLLIDIEEDPVLYTANISAPVCADGACRLMNIRIYWSILGRYAGFDRIKGLPLTKHDHDEFLEMDYLKLHQLLIDDNSILKRREIDDLVETPKDTMMEYVDGISGATKEEVKESVVSGALYSCYIAWHLVHGEVKSEIKNHTLSLMNDEMLIGMLNSNNADYQFFALNRLNRHQYEDHYVRVAEIFKTGIPLVRTFIVKSLPQSFWKSDELQKPFWNCFSTIDINSRSLMLEHLGKAPESVLESISTELQIMTKNQLKKYLRDLKERGNLSAVTMMNLEDFAISENAAFVYLVKEFLEDKN